MKSILIRMSVLGLAVLAFAGCRQEAPPAFERPPAPVAVAAVGTRDVPVYLDEVGKVGLGGGWRVASVEQSER